MIQLFEKPAIYPVKLKLKFITVSFFQLGTPNHLTQLINLITALVNAPRATFCRISSWVSWVVIWTVHVCVRAACFASQRVKLWRVVEDCRGRHHQDKLLHAFEVA